MDNKFGLYKSPLDTRDFVVSSFLEAKVLPDEFSLKDKMTPVRNQGNEGSCAGQAFGAGVKEYQEQKQYNQFIPLSTRFVYEEAKKISGHSEGTTLKACCVVLYKYGICEETYWPYKANEVGNPDPGFMENAEKYKIKTYARITNIAELKRALVDPKIGPIAVGVKVFKGIRSDQAKNYGIVPNPSCFDSLRVLGGHALCMTSYKDNSPYYKNDGHIECKNSWGKYGNRGYLYFSYTYIKKHMLDAFSCVDATVIDSEDLIRVAHIVHAEGVWV